MLQAFPQKQVTSACEIVFIVLSCNSFQTLSSLFSSFIKSVCPISQQLITYCSTCVCCVEDVGLTKSIPFLWFRERVEIDHTVTCTNRPVGCAEILLAQAENSLLLGVAHVAVSDLLRSPKSD